MDTLLLPLVQWFSKQTQEERWQLSALFWLSVGFVIHYLFFCIPQPFFIEDAGISFAYAKHFANGEGFVAYPGGERVEGFSNPLWTFLMAACHFVGLSVWVSAKVWGAVFGVATLPFIYGLVRRAGVGTKEAMIAPLMLVLSPNFVIWCGAGLENSLYVFLIAWGMWRLFVESEQDKHPWSAFIFCLVAMTRPEGVMYAVLAGVAMAIFAIVDKRWKAIPLWSLAFVIPFALYQWWRFEYFGWPYPNTYYAKLGAGTRFKPFSWTSRGWKYINQYLFDHHVFTFGIDKSVFGRKEWGLNLAYFLPLLIVAMNGIKTRWQRISTIGLTLFLAFVIVWDGRWSGGPEWWQPLLKKWIHIRVWSILAVALLIGLTSLRRPNWRVRSVLWLLGSSSVFFVIYSGGDWMKAHRWFNVVEIFMLPMLLLGAADLISLMPRKVLLPKWPWTTNAALATLTLLVCFAVSEIRVSAIFVASPETTVSDVHRRVRYMQWVQRRLDVDHVTLLDVDMGAHMMYSGWDIVDTAGLVDVSIARHSDYNRKFIREYVFKERKPEFAHCHGGWAKTSKIPRNSEWSRDYLEISGYPVSKRKLHIGNHVRRDLFIHPKTQTEATQGWWFEGGIRLTQLSVPSPYVAPGGALFIEQRWTVETERSADVQVLFALIKDDEIVQTGAFQPGYRWYDMEEWDSDEIVVGKFPMPISTELPTGEYDLKVALLDTMSGQSLASDGSTEIQGVVWTNTDIQVTIGSEAMTQANERRTESMQLADDGDCDQSWRVWKNATRHVYRNRRWQERHKKSHETTVAQCFLNRAISESDEVKQQEWLLLARKWDHNVDGLTDMVNPMAEKLDLDGQQKMLLEDWVGAYDDFSLSVALDPSRSHTRRRAEEARDKRLNIEAPYNKTTK